MPVATSSRNAVILPLFPSHAVEVGTGGPGYRWVNGYAAAGPAGISQPLTRRQWQQIARRDGCRCVFYASERLARRFMFGGTYEYHTNCVSASARDIDAMRNASREVSYRTFIKHCPDAREVLGYTRGSGLTLAGDWHVSFYRSTFRGEPCFYARHSAIEYIWIKVPKGKP